MGNLIKLIGDVFFMHGYTEVHFKREVKIYEYGVFNKDNKNCI